MTQLTIELTDAEYEILQKLAIPDEDGKLPMRGIKRGNDSFNDVMSLERKGLVIVHFTTSWDEGWCSLSTAGMFIMNFKGRAMRILSMGE